MMKDSLPVIHIGYAKAGGTTFTEYVVQSHPDIAMHDPGPKSGPGYQLIHRISVPTLADFDDELDTYREQEIEPLTKNGKALFFRRAGWGLLSGPNSKWAAERLRRLCGPSRPVFLIRNQLTWLESYYTHLLVTGKLVFGTPIEMYLRHAWVSRIHGIQEAIDYDQTISIYEDVFGPENVGVFLFEHLKADPQDFARSVYSFIGVDPDRVDFSRGMGARSASERGDEAPRLMARLSRLGHFRLRYNILPNVSISKHLPDKVDRWFRKTVNPPLSVTIPEDYAQRIRTRYADSNARLAERHKLPLEQYGYPVKS